jgi:probable F420-dependent oxidoreductase
MADLRAAWRAVDQLGADSIWTWDHFFPIDGDPAGHHFEAWSLLAAMAVETTSARLGTLVTCISYRNPDLLADIARTVDHLSGGRVNLGIGAGWNRRDYEEYGFEMGSFKERLLYLDGAVARIQRRLSLLSPPPVGPLPILVGGEGERILLRIVAERANIWNGWGPITRWAPKNKALDAWCARLGRPPQEVERSVLMAEGETADAVGGYIDEGAQHIICEARYPIDLTQVEETVRRVHQLGS